MAIKNNVHTFNCLFAYNCCSNWYLLLQLDFLWEKQYYVKETLVCVVYYIIANC